MATLFEMTLGRVFRQRHSVRTSSHTPANSVAPQSTMASTSGNGSGASSARSSAASSSAKTTAVKRQRSNGRSAPGVPGQLGAALPVPIDEATPALEILEARRAAEKSFVREHDTSVADLWYLVDIGWLDAWKCFVSKGGPLPGPIRTDVLMDPRTGKPRPHKRAIQHYRGVNSDIWEFWSRRYGAGPPIRRHKLDLYAAPFPEDERRLPEQWGDITLPQVEPSASLAVPAVPGQQQQQRQRQDQQQQQQQQHQRPRGRQQSAIADQTSAAAGRQSVASRQGEKDTSARRSGESASRSCGQQTPDRSRRPSPGMETDDRTSGNDGTPTVYFVAQAEACIVSQPPDGSCLFHSLSYGLDDGSDACSLRKEIGEYLAKNAEMEIAGMALKDWVEFDSGGGVDDYAAEIADMALGSWGGGIELETFALLKGVHVHVYETCPGGYHRISCFDAGDGEVRKVINVLYRGRTRGCEHYDALMMGEACGHWVPRPAKSAEPGATGGA